MPSRAFRLLGLIAPMLLAWLAAPVFASEFSQPWRDKQRALVLDGYEFNEFDLSKIAQNQRIVGFIHKGSDGLPAAYRCSGNETEKKLCIQTWRRYVMGQQLYHARRALAKKLGLKWGAYHLGRPGNPIEQAQHFLTYTEPADDEIVVIDIEDNDPEKWMSLEDAEIFARFIYRRLGRWPMLYTNGSTAKFIADNREDYPILSRLPLWYARYRSDITGFFPKGHWDSYAIWQFQAQINCNKKSCAMRIDGTNDDIDINVVDMSVEELRAAWPFDALTEPVDADADNDYLMVFGGGKPGVSRASLGSKPQVTDIDIYKMYTEAAMARGVSVGLLQRDAMTTTAIPHPE